jgi:hypothetical protein
MTTPPLILVPTIRYKTYVKQALVEALQNVFKLHPDKILAKTKIGIDFPVTELDYPMIIIRFLGRSVYNAGVGHIETLPDKVDPTKFHKFKHNLYKGDIEFAIYTLSSYDRDLIGDSLVQIISMGDLESYSNEFFKRIYDYNYPNDAYTPNTHYININTDQINDFGETQGLAPWMPEDVYVFQSSYRVGIFGEFYSRIVDNVSYGLVEKVETYPYRSQFDPEPLPNPNPLDPSPWE